jgi:hypothetical protein
MNDRARTVVDELRLGLAELDGFVSAETSKAPGAECAAPLLKIEELQNAVGSLIVLTHGIIAVLEEVTADE